MASNRNFVKAQRGLSVIELMVGLLLSILGVLAGLTLYRDMVHVTADSTYDSSFDGQLAALLLQIQLELQGVGYGLDKTGPSPIEIKLGTAGSEKFQSVYWRLKTDGTTVTCRGIEERSVGTQPKTRVITLVQATSGCSETADLKNLTWTPLTEMARFPVRPSVQAYLDANTATGSLLTFAVAEVQCAPFGAGDPETHKAVILTAPTATFLHNFASSSSSSGAAGPAGVKVETLNLCLPNT